MHREVLSRSFLNAAFTWLLPDFHCLLDPQICVPPASPDFIIGSTFANEMYNDIEVIPNLDFFFLPYKYAQVGAEGQVHHPNVPFLTGS